MRNVLLVSKPRHDVQVKPRATIAFIEFEHISKTIEYWKTHDAICAAQVAAAIAQHLADLNEFKVVTREHLGSVLSELTLIHSGSVNSAGAARLGELTGADILIYGQVQLCVPGEPSNNSASSSASKEPQKEAPTTDPVQILVEKNTKGTMRDLLGAFLNRKVENDRSFIQAQIQLIEAETGKRIFTSSLQGEFLRTKGKDSRDMSERELLARAADNLADNFIDDFLQRREPLYIGLYSGSSVDLDKGIDYIQLGDCPKAEQHFHDLYLQNKDRLKNKEIAKLMYNHGISLMCSNRPDEALSRLWASLRLLNNAVTFSTIAFTDDTIDRGRVIMAEPDPIIGDVREKLPYSSLSAMDDPPQAENMVPPQAVKPLG